MNSAPEQPEGPLPAAKSRPPLAGSSSRDAMKPPPTPIFYRSLAVALAAGAVGVVVAFLMTPHRTDAMRWTLAAGLTIAVIGVLAIMFATNRRTVYIEELVAQASDPGSTPKCRKEIAEDLRKTGAYDKAREVLAPPSRSETSDGK